MGQKNKKTLLINLGASLIVFLVQLIISFWVTPYVVGKLGESAYGFITLALNFTEYATLLTVAINSMASRFISISYNQNNVEEANEYFSSVFWFNIILSSIILVLSIFLVVNINHIINIPSSQINDVKITFALTFFNLIVSFISTCYAATPFVTNRMDYNAYVQIVSKFVRLVLTILLFLLCVPRIYYVGLANLIATLIALLIYMYIKNVLTPEFSIRLCYFSFKKLIIIAKSGVWMLLSNLSSLLLNGMDLLIANLLISPDAMGRLSVSKQLPMAVSSLLGYLSSIFTASLTQLVALGKKSELVEEIKFTFRILGTFLTVPFAGIIIYGISFLYLWLPEGVYTYAEIIEIYILMMLTLSNIIVNAYMYSLHSLYIAINKVKMYSIVIFVCSVISVFTTIILTKFSGLGVYAIAGTSTIILSLINLFWVPMYAEKVLNIKTFSFMKTIMKNYIALIMTCIIFKILSNFLVLNNWTYFLLSCMLSALIGYVFAFNFILKKEERKRVKDVISKKLGVGI